MRKIVFDSKWGEKKKQIMDLLAIRDMSVSELCKQVDATPNQVYSMIAHIPDDALVYEIEGPNGKTIYGRLKNARTV
ncbi:MAG: hypothetical protein MJZ25_13130 [Fibrobacter sp.]|nr:hypothetical protein [Fibrobacter sp.]